MARGRRNAFRGTIAAAFPSLAWLLALAAAGCDAATGVSAGTWTGAALYTYHATAGGGDRAPERIGEWHLPPAATAPPKVVPRVLPRLGDEGLSRAARRALEAINAERARRGLGALSWDPRLAFAAGRHSRDCAGRAELSHEGSDGSRVRDRVLAPAADAAGPRAQWRDLGEILASNNHDDPIAAAVRGWLDSPGHRALMLGAQYSRAGVGVAQDKQGMYYFTVVLMQPR